MSGDAFRLKAGEPVAQGVRRAAGGRAAKAAERLRNRAPEDLAKAVHGARKDLKKLRSLLRLVRTGMDEGAYRRENDRFRAASRAMEGPRDAEAKLESLTGLRERYGGEFPTRWSLGFLEMLEAERDRIASGPAPPGVVEAVERIEAGQRASHSWKLSGDGFGLFEPGLRRAYKRGRDGLDTALGGPTGEELHAWRKRVKDLWYQLDFLERAWPEPMRAISEEAHELSSILGDHHDLVSMAREIELHPELFKGESQTKMLALIQLRQQELLDGALPIGRRLYFEKPKRFTARIGFYWKQAG